MKLRLLRGLNGRMLLSIGSAVTLGLVVLAVIVTLGAMRVARTDALVLSHNQARLVGLEMGRRLDAAMDTARALAQSLEALHGVGDPSRAMADAMLRRALEASPEYIAVWTLWEPDAFDGRDKEFANKPGHDATGRYVPYWNRGPGHIVLEPLLDYTTEGAGDYYLIAKRTNRETVLEPYVYQVAGQSVLMTSLVVPVHGIDGAFLGVAGVDIPLSLLSEEIARQKVGESGYAALVSNGGLYVAHPRAERAGNPMLKTDPWVEPFLGHISGGRAFETESFSQTVGDNTFRIGAPVPIGASTTPWSVVVTLREGEVLASAFRMRDLIIGISASILAGVLLVVWWIARGITRPVRAIALELAEGADQVASAAGQVSASGQKLAEGASEQAASLEESSASLEELAGMTKRNAEHAEHAKLFAADTRRAADTGAADLREMSAAMSDLRTANTNVGKIVKTIDEIAFQTNILALNAAVEAARAGAAGAGFAVVADEVRSLAQRSAVAARETASTIEESLRMSARGVALSDKVAGGFSVILEKARQVDELVAGIASASREQSEGLLQINNAVGQMDKVTQANASGAEEGAAAAEEMSGQAAVLKSCAGDLLALVDGTSRPVPASASDAPST